MEIDGNVIVQDLSLDVPDGRIVGLIGPNGSGKSTALRCVYRALRPSRGVVWLGSDDLSTLKLRRSARSVAALTQDGGTDLDFTVAETVAGFEAHAGGAVVQADQGRPAECLADVLVHVFPSEWSGLGVVPVQHGPIGAEL
ncbi:ABC transporter ATP-binding protein [Micromonospora sp. NPDC049060]|uniref:ABC transporter ATP-binding protein n=1 Tax=Micromonospora sp. NPDC049060 TaxID=3154828 RepID=UPI0033FC8DE5